MGNELSDAGRVITHLPETVYDSTLKPVFKPVYEEVLRPGGEIAGKVISRQAERFDRLTNLPLQAGESLINFLNNPTFMYVLLALAGILLISAVRK